MIINLRYIRIIFFIINLDFLKREILSILIKKIAYQTIYLLGLKIYLF